MWQADARGFVQVNPRCHALRTRLWNDDPLVRMTFYGRTLLAQRPRLGQLFSVKRPPPLEGPPRLRSALVLPCNRPILVISRNATRFHMAKSVGCNGYLSALLWLDEPGTLVLRFRGGAREHHARKGGRSWVIKPGSGTITTVRVPVPAGNSNPKVLLDWKRTLGAPEVVGAELESASGTTPLL